MKLHYYSSISDRSVSTRFVNFGDDLNSFIWDQLFPGLIDDDDSTVFSGIGSHLNSQFIDKYPDSKHVVFGTGYGYGESIGKVNGDWDIYFVRGPLTAKSMGLDENLAVTDAALLVRELHEPFTDKDIPVSLMPHVASITSAQSSWKKISDSTGYNLIDVRSPIESVFDQINRSQLLLTEALHGAIVSDSLRTPWVPFVSNPTVSELKWSDWCQSIGVDYSPMRIPPLWADAGERGVGNLRTYVKIKYISRTLRKCTTKKRYVSSDGRINNLLEVIREKSATLRDSYCQR